jgi:hypothetical protein
MEQLVTLDSWLVRPVQGKRLFDTHIFGWCEYKYRSRGTPIPTQCFALQTQWFCLESTHLFYLIDKVILLCRHSSFAWEHVFRHSVLLSIDTVVLLRIDTPFYLIYTVILLYKHSCFALERHSTILAVELLTMLLAPTALRYFSDWCPNLSDDSLKFSHYNQ